MLETNFFNKKLLTALIVLLVFNNYAIAASARRINADSSKKPLLAVVETSNNYFTIANNVAYPNILAGNESETLDYIEKFADNRRDYLIRMHNKGKKFFPKIEKTLKKHNVPQEFKVLIALESAFNGNAESGAGAVGYWQIMDEVANEYGLKYIPKLSAEEKKLAAKNKALKIPDTVKVKKHTIKDERKNLNRSTQVAARYLRDRCKNLNNNWLLVAASYNCGVGNVWEAMRKSGKSNPSFWDVKAYLPAETRNYVMNFIALNVVYHNYEKFANNTLNFKPIKIKVNTAVQSISENTDKK